MKQTPVKVKRCYLGGRHLKTEIAKRILFHVAFLFPTNSPLVCQCFSLFITSKPTLLLGATLTFTHHFERLSQYSDRSK